MCIVAPRQEMFEYLFGIVDLTALTRDMEVASGSFVWCVHAMQGVMFS